MGSKSVQICVTSFMDDPQQVVGKRFYVCGSGSVTVIGHWCSSRFIGDKLGTSDLALSNEPIFHNYGDSVMIGNRLWITGGDAAGRFYRWYSKTLLSVLFHRFHRMQLQTKSNNKKLKHISNITKNILDDFVQMDDSTYFVFIFALIVFGQSQPPLYRL